VAGRAVKATSERLRVKGGTRARKGVTRMDVTVVQDQARLVRELKEVVKGRRRVVECHIDDLALTMLYLADNGYGGRYEPIGEDLWRVEVKRMVQA
jgi:hypothetical protein